MIKFILILLLIVGCNQFTAERIKKCKKEESGTVIKISCLHELSKPPDERFDSCLSQLLLYNKCEDRYK
jgi:hypothetical protein